VYGCETWSVSLGEESRPRVFENGVMKKVFGPEKEEFIGDCRKQYNEKVNDDDKDNDSKGNILIINTKDEWAGKVARVGVR